MREQELDELSAVVQINRTVHNCHQRNDEQHDVRETEKSLRLSSSESNKSFCRDYEEKSVTDEPFAAQYVSHLWLRNVPHSSWLNRYCRAHAATPERMSSATARSRLAWRVRSFICRIAVSYTHLTLPTSDL